MALHDDLFEWTYAPTVWYDSSSMALCFAIRRYNKAYPRCVQILRHGCDSELGYWEPFEIGSAGAPLCSLGQPQALRLLESLVAAGIKPGAMIESEGQKKALEDHLSDMRKIVSKTIGVAL